MASKKATIFIVDLGATMGDCHNGRDISDLEYGMQWAWDKMANIMSRGLKGDNIGVLALRTDDTNHHLSGTGDESYDHISVLKDLGVLDMGGLRDLQEAIIVSSTEEGDAISAIVIAVDSIKNFTTLKTGKPGKYERAIYLLTDGQGAMDASDIDSIAEQLNNTETRLTVIGIDFDSEDPEFKEEDKSSVKRENEKHLRNLVEKCENGDLVTAAEAVDSVSIPSVREVRPIASYTGILQLGDDKKYPDSTVLIDVVRYPKTKIAKPVSASQFVQRPGSSNDEASGENGSGLSAVHNIRTYEVLDPSAPGGKLEVQRDELAKGYLYGRTIVPIGEEEEAIARIPSFKSLSIIGFIPSDKYEKYFNMGESSITIAPNSSEKARMALSSLVHALYESESYAVARLVPKDDKDPQIVLMAPYIEPTLEALVDVVLPFAEDIRMYQFPPLDRVVTTSGAVLTKHRNLPADDLAQAMSDYVDAMDLSKFGEDDEGQPAEYMPFDETYNPNIHKIDQAIRQRAIYPESAIGPPAPILTKWQHPPPELVERSTELLSRLVAAAEVKQVEERKKGRFKHAREEAPKPLSDLNIDDLLSGRKRQKISAENAIPEFKQMVQSADKDEIITDAIEQLGAISRTLITSPGTGAKGFDQAFANINQMREVAVELEIPEVYNDFVSDLKGRLQKKELGGEREDFWLKFKHLGFGLITKDEVKFSTVTEKEAEEFNDISIHLPDRSRS